MSGSVADSKPVKGLKANEVLSLQQRFGKNLFDIDGSRRFLHTVLDILREPMFILLVIACFLYFILGNPQEGFLMMVAIVLVTAISVYQDAKSTRALKTLKQYTDPRVTVLRDGEEKIIAAEELVPGDVMLLAEGNTVPADALLLHTNDLTVNESIITGESFPAEKHTGPDHNTLYQGSSINSGYCTAMVTETGNRTMLGRLGKAVAVHQAARTLLQEQIGYFVRRLAFFGLSAFVVIWVVNFLRSGSPVQSLLFGLTLAMAAIPEEIPVAFSSFMALGALRLSKLGIITRQPQTVENLGAVTVICLDKTGTITENKMEVRGVYDAVAGTLLASGAARREPGTASILYYAMLASEAYPFDAMEKAIVEAYTQYVDPVKYPPLKLVYEYALAGRPPMMTHVYQQGNNRLVAAKGGAEKILEICSPDAGRKQAIMEQIREQASKGYRVIGVAGARHPDAPMPAAQEDFDWTFLGLLSLYDPPRKNIASVFRQFYAAHIGVKLLTGDYPETALHIAEETGMKDYLPAMTGEEVLAMNEDELRGVVKRINLFARMFPEAKLKVIEALKAGGEIVAMTGDGVNDGPALKSADIGIAMGKRGAEIARQAADLVLTDDNAERIVEAIRQGRRIFRNLKKAVRYIISIHIPIIVTATLPVLLGWRYPNIFTPIHVIFLELIMGPTCSIFFEREPPEKGEMQQSPRDRTTGLFGRGELATSITQGIVIASGVLALYYYFMQRQDSIEQTRTIVFNTLVLGNIFLTFVNRSFTESFLKTIRYKNNLAPWLLPVSVGFLVVIHVIPLVRRLFGMTSISLHDWICCTIVAALSVCWFEGYKLLSH